MLGVGETELEWHRRPLESELRLSITALLELFFHGHIINSQNHPVAGEYNNHTCLCAIGSTATSTSTHS